MKTLHIDSEKWWGGGQRQVAGLCSYLKEQGHEVIIACRPGSKLEAWAKDAGIRTCPVPMKSSLDIGSVLKLRSIIKHENPDVIHLHASRAHVLGSAAARLAGAKVVIVTRRMQDKVKWGWPNTSAYGDWVSVVIAISQTVKESLVESSVNPGKIRVIDSGADVDSFVNASPDPLLRKSWGIDEGVPVICTAATLCENKGVDHIIQAAALLVNKGVRLHLVIAGDGPLRSELETLAKRLRVPASFIGFQTDMPSVIASIDVFVMASMAEGLGIAVLEAMGSAKSVVANAVGGLRESVVDGETGFLVPPKYPQAMSEAIEKLLMDTEMAQRFGLAGRERVLTKYSITKMAQRNEELYYELCSESKRENNSTTDEHGLTRIREQ